MYSGILTCGSVHTYCINVRRWTQPATQTELGPVHIAVCPCARIKVGRRTQSERGFTLQTE